MARFLSLSATIIKMLLGAMFLFSAATKVVSVEKFEVYIYSLGFLSMGLSFLAARLMIAIELLMGAWLLSNKFHKAACLLNLLVLAGLTILLVYIQLTGHTENCHCFGEALSFTPIQSILKNAIIILLVLFAWKYADNSWRPRWWAALALSAIPFALLIALGFMGKIQMMYADLYTTIGLAACMISVGILSSLLLWKHQTLKSLWKSRWWIIVPMILAPIVATAAVTTAPEDWTTSTTRYPFNENLFRANLTPEGAFESIDSPKIICFFSTYCQYCHQTAHKLTAIRQHNDLPEEYFINIFPGTDSTDFSQFYELSDSEKRAEIPIQRDLFAEITYGQYPLIVLWTGDSVAGTYSINVSERAIIDFINATKH